MPKRILPPARRRRRRVGRWAWWPWARPSPGVPAVGSGAARRLRRTPPLREAFRGALAECRAGRVWGSGPPPSPRECPAECGGGLPAQVRKPGRRDSLSEAARRTSVAPRARCDRGGAALDREMAPRVQVQVPANRTERLRRRGPRRLPPGRTRGTWRRRRVDVSDIRAARRERLDRVAVPETHTPPAGGTPAVSTRRRRGRGRGAGGPNATADPFVAGPTSPARNRGRSAVSARPSSSPRAARGGAAAAHRSAGAPRLAAHSNGAPAKRRVRP